jgi:hypothetical protein
VFDAVQAKLNEQVNNHKASRTNSEALLFGRIYDDRGQVFASGRISSVLSSPAYRDFTKAGATQYCIPTRMRRHRKSQRCENSFKTSKFLQPACMAPKRSLLGIGVPVPSRITLKSTLTSLLQFHAGGFHHLGPMGELRAHKLAIAFRRSAGWLGTELGESLANSRRRQRLVDGGV